MEKSLQGGDSVLDFVSLTPRSHVALTKPRISSLSLTILQPYCMKIILIGYIAGILAQILYNLVLGFIQEVTWRTIIAWVIVLGIGLVIDIVILLSVNCNTLKSKWLPGLAIFQAVVIQCGDLSAIHTMLDEEELDTKPPIFLFIWLLIILVPLQAKFKYKRSQYTCLGIMSVTATIQFIIGNPIDTALTLSVLCIVVYIETSILAQTPQNVIDDFKSHRSLRSARRQLSFNSKNLLKIHPSPRSNVMDDERDIDEESAIVEFDQVVEKSNQVEEILHEIDKNALSDRQYRLVTLASTLSHQINQTYMIGNTAFQKFIENYKDLMNQEENQCLVSNHVSAHIDETTGLNSIIREEKAFIFGEYGPQELNSMLKKIGVDWNFDMFHVADWSKHPVVISGLYIIQSYDIPGVDEKKLLSFLRELEESYRSENPYHNPVHAADVMGAIIFIIQNSDLIKYLTQKDILCCIISWLGHDVAHPGMTNRYLIAVQDELALKYNDQSVLESMHCSKTFEIMLKEENSICSHFTNEDFAVIRKIIVTMILATDMAKHFDMVVSFRNNYLHKKHELTNLNNFDERLTVLTMAIKWADIGHSAKRNDLHVKWSNAICEEFFTQGDIEREKGLPISMFCDRETVNFAASQSGFIKNLAMPLFLGLNQYLQSIKIRKSCQDQLEKNLQYWEKQNRRSRQPTGKTNKESLELKLAPSDTCSFAKARTISNIQ